MGPDLICQIIDYDYCLKNGGIILQLKTRLSTGEIQFEQSNECNALLLK